MSGNLWMFSDKLDDEDIEIMKHEFITYYQGADYYGLGLKMFTRLAHEAGAVYKIGKKVLIRRTIFDEYLRQQYHIEQMASLAADGKEASTRQGTLVLDTDSGRMNIRFGLNDYYGFLSCGTRMEVRVDGEWIPTRLEMADNWILMTDKGGCFSTYAYRLIWNEICDELIRNTRLVLNEQSTDTVDVLSEAASAHPDPLTIFDLRHTIGQAKAKAQGGTARGIQCLELTVQGYTSKEIGAIVGADPGTVRMWMTRARKYLKGLPELRAFGYPEAV